MIVLFFPLRSVHRNFPEALQRHEAKRKRKKKDCVRHFRNESALDHFGSFVLFIIFLSYAHLDCPIGTFRVRSPRPVPRPTVSKPTGRWIWAATAAAAELRVSSTSWRLRCR